VEAHLIPSKTTQKQGVVGAGAKEKPDFSPQIPERGGDWAEFCQRGALGSFLAFVKANLARKRTCLHKVK
jgi:hypothetical protein